eukprot:9151587-Pyramimonas_sp.AAC.1
MPMGPACSLLQLRFKQVVLLDQENVRTALRGPSFETASRVGLPRRDVGSLDDELNTRIPRAGVRAWKGTNLEA